MPVGLLSCSATCIASRSPLWSSSDRSVMRVGNLGAGYSVLAVYHLLSSLPHKEATQADITRTTNGLAASLRVLPKDGVNARLPVVLRGRAGGVARWVAVGVQEDIPRLR